MTIRLGRALSVSILSLTLFLAAHPARTGPAESPNSGTPLDIRSSLSGTFLYNEGDVKFGYLNPPWESRLRFPMDGYLVELKGESVLHFSLSDLPASAGLRGRIARDVRARGTTTDEDWFGNYRWGYSEHSGDADILIWDIEGIFSIRPFYQLDHPAVKSIEAGLTAGYGEQSFKFLSKDGRGWYDGEDYDFRGPVSTYKADFTGLRIGAYAQFRPEPRLSLRIEATVVPNLEADTDAFWILRNYHFRQKAEGTGTVIGIRGSYELTDHLSVFAGLRRTFLNADKRGRESGIFYDDGDSYTDLPVVPYISAKYFNVEAGLTALF